MDSPHFVHSSAGGPLGLILVIMNNAAVHSRVKVFVVYMLSFLLSMDLEVDCWVI